MISFRQLPDDHPDFIYSPLLRAARLTLGYMVETGPIGITKTKAFKRYFVRWAAEHFEWPGRSYDDLMRYHKCSTSMTSRRWSFFTSCLSN